MESLEIWLRERVRGVSYKCTQSSGDSQHPNETGWQISGRVSGKGKKSCDTSVSHALIVLVQLVGGETEGRMEGRSE